jgi:CDP-alcohol phosphatidyltransferase
MPSSPTRAHNGPQRKGAVAANDGSAGTDERRQASQSPLINHNVVFLFIPNLIGYARIILAASSLYFMRWHPKYCTWLYIVSCLLDAFDGMAARRFGQSKCPFFVLLFVLVVNFKCYLWTLANFTLKRANLVLSWTWSQIVVPRLVFCAIFHPHILTTPFTSRSLFLLIWRLITCICTGISSFSFLWLFC